MRRALVVVLCPLLFAVGCSDDEAATPAVQIRPLLAECAPSGSPVGAAPAVGEPASFAFEIDGGVLTCSAGPGIPVPEGTVSDTPADPAVTGGAPTLVLDLPPDAMTAFNVIASSCYQQDQRCPVGQALVTLGTDVVSIATVVVPEFEGSLQLAMADEATVQRVAAALGG
ncbi:MAG: hypothetical protein RL238_362 [Actinomycetota bacterium]|jgi:hypothetical protein